MKFLVFGGMISGKLLVVNSVAKAHDLVGENFIKEETYNAGARHRSAYSLASGYQEQWQSSFRKNGVIRFVRQKEGRVTYREQE